MKCRESDTAKRLWQHNRGLGCKIHALTNPAVCSVMKGEQKGMRGRRRREGRGGGVNSSWLAGVRNEVHHVGQQLGPAQTEVSRSTQ